MVNKSPNNQLKKIIFITGPTAIGKSENAIYLAQKINGEIINADSRQVYKYLNIGSGKLSKQELKIVPHHLIDVASPRKNYSLGQWLKAAEAAVKKIMQKNKIPIFCGGTILYLKALKEGWLLPAVKPNYNLRKKLSQLSSEDLYKKLQQLDKLRAKTIDRHNKKRLIRALEIIYVLGKVPPLIKKPKYQILILCPQIDKKNLFHKIEIRLKQRLPFIIKEVKKLKTLGLSFKRIINFGLEYRWFGLYVSNQNKNNIYADINFIYNSCLQDIKNFAKRQIKELNKIPEVYYFKNKRDLYAISKKFIENL